MTLVAPPAWTASRTQSIMGRPQIGCSTFGVRDRIRVPCPAARMTAVNSWLKCEFRDYTGALFGPPAVRVADLMKRLFAFGAVLLIGEEPASHQAQVSWVFTPAEYWPNS